MKKNNAYQKLRLPWGRVLNVVQLPGLNLRALRAFAVNQVYK
jgi:hypothetical protein